MLTAELREYVPKKLAKALDDTKQFAFDLETRAAPGRPEKDALDERTCVPFLLVVASGKESKAFSFDDPLLHAAHALGMETLRNLSMAACLSGAFPKVQGLDRTKFWRHSVATASWRRSGQGMRSSCPPSPSPPPRPPSC